MSKRKTNWLSFLLTLFLLSNTPHSNSNAHISDWTRIK